MTRAQPPRYWTVHRRLAVQRGPATEHACAECGRPARWWSYDGTDPDEHTDAGRGHRYSLDPGRYRPRCASCHRTSTAGHQPITDEAARQAAALYQAGRSLAAIAATLGVSRPALRTALTARGVTIRPPRPSGPVVDEDEITALYATGTTLRAIAIRLSTSRRVVRAVLAARGVPIRRRTPEVDGERAAALYAAGASLAGIAALLDVTGPAVRAALTARGVAIRPPGPARRHLRMDATSFPSPRPDAESPTPARNAGSRPSVIFQPLLTTSRQPSIPTRPDMPTSTRP